MENSVTSNMSPEAVVTFMQQNVPLMIVCIALTVLEIIAMWKIFAKAGEAGWKSIIPIYNMYILYKITFGNGLFFLFLLIPVADIIIQIICDVKLAKAFGHGIGFGIGLIFLSPIFTMILGFNDDTYLGPQ